MATKKNSLFNPDKVNPKLLPERLSAGIRLAVADVVAVERSKKFSMEMSTWLNPKRGVGKTCEVCFAGAVMVKTLGAPSTVDKYKPMEDIYDELIGTSPQHFDPAVSNKLNALDYVREYNVVEAIESYSSYVGTAPNFAYAGCDNEIFCQGLDTVDYHRNPEEWKENMLTIADRLEAFGY